MKRCVPDCAGRRVEECCVAEDEEEKTAVDEIVLNFG